MEYILAIESSCDDTSAAVIKDAKVVSNVVNSQEVHKKYGGVVPELASREHQQVIVPVVDQALQEAGISPTDLSAIAFTRGPGLLGSLIVGVAFAKTMAQSLDIPLVEVHHMHAHVLANLSVDPAPEFPFLCLTVSGGHTQIIKVDSPLELTILGTTIDDAAGEALDKTGKMLGLPYPAGPVIDKLAKDGKAIYPFPFPRVDQYDFSFSGLKTSILRFLQKEMKADDQFIKNEMSNICASVQDTVVRILLSKLTSAAEDHRITHLALAGGVAANSQLRHDFHQLCELNGWHAYIPSFKLCTDNAGMIGIAGYHRFKAGLFTTLDIQGQARLPFDSI